MLLAGFLIGVFAGFGISVPFRVKAGISGEPVFHQISNSTKAKQYLSMNSDYVVWIEGGVNNDFETQLHVYNRNTKQDAVTTSPDYYFQGASVQGSKVLIKGTTKDWNSNSLLLYDLEDSQLYNLGFYPSASMGPNGGLVFDNYQLVASSPTSPTSTQFQIYNLYSDPGHTTKAYTSTSVQNPLTPSTSFSVTDTYSFSIKGPQLVNGKIVYGKSRRFSFNTYDYFVWDPELQTSFALPPSFGSGNSFQFESFGSKVANLKTLPNGHTGYYIYDVDFNPAMPTYRFGFGDSDPALSTYDLGGGSTGCNSKFFGTEILACDNSALKLYSTTGADTMLVESASTFQNNNSYTAYGNAVSQIKVIEGNQQVFFSTLESDAESPIFENLPVDDKAINLTNNQVIEQSQVDVIVNPTDTGSGIYKVVYLIDGQVATARYAPEADGTYKGSLDIKQNRPEGVVIKAVAYDLANNTSEISVTVKPDPLVLPYITSTQKTDGMSGIQEINPVSNGEFLAYKTTNPYEDGMATVFLKNLTTNVITQISDNKATGASSPLKINDNYVYWPDAGRGLVVYSLLSGQKVYIQPNGYTYGLQLEGTTLYWEADSRVYSQSIFSDTPTTILTLTGSEAFSSSSLGVEGNHLYVPISHWDTGVHEISQINLIDKSTRSLFTAPYMIYFSYYGGKIGYSYQDGVTYRVGIYDVGLGQNKIVESDEQIAYNVSIGEKYMTWADFDAMNTPVTYNYRISLYDIQKEKLLNVTTIYDPVTGYNYTSDYPSVQGDYIWYNSTFPGADGMNKVYQALIDYPDTVSPTIVSASGLYGVNGGVANISVTATDNRKAVRARISVDGGAFSEMSGSSSPFKYQLQIPANFMGNSIPVKIRVYDVTGNYAEVAYVVAVNDETPPTIDKLEIPQGKTGEKAVVKITANDNVALDKVEVSVAGAPYQSVIKNGGTYNYSINVPADSLQPISFDVRATDLPGHLVEKKGNKLSVIDVIPPTIIMVQSSLEADEGGTIIASATDNIAPTKAELRLKDSPVWMPMVGTASPFTYSVSKGDVKGITKLVIYVRVYDAAGNVSTTEPKEDSVATLTNTNTPSGSNPDTLLERLKNGATFVMGTFRNTIEQTPTPVAKAFPYILFLLLGLSALVFMRQVEVESEQLGTKMELVKFRRQIVEQKDNFVILASHYLRTPVTLISNGAEMLMDTLKGDGKNKLKKATTGLVQATQEVVSKIESSEKLKEIKLPDPKKETIKIVLSPFVLLPVVAVGGLAFTANYVFQNVGKITVTRSNLFAEIIVFVIAVQVFVYFYRKRRIQKANLKYFDETMKYEVAIDESKSVLMVNSKKTLEDQLEIVKSALPEKANDFVNEGISRLEQILTKIGYLSGLKFSDIQVSAKGFKVEDLIKEIVRSRQDLTTENEVKIKFDCKDVKLGKNREIIKEILTELLDNAIKFSPKGGTVKIACAQDDDGLVNISITDEGKGITKDEQMALFKPFSRTSSALHFNHEGLGLGLYYSRSLTNMLGGDIFIKSAKDKGTTITVNI